MAGKKPLKKRSVRREKVPTQVDEEGQLVAAAPSMPNLDISVNENGEMEYSSYFMGGLVRCGAKAKKNGLKCRQPAMENGRCRMHGGASTGPPKGNKNGVIHGAYERILYATLNDDEVFAFHDMKTDVLANIEITLKILNIREARMLERMEQVRESGNYLTTSIEREEGYKEKGSVDFKRRRKEGALGIIQRIEEALTKVQAQKAQYLDLKLKVEAATKSEDVPNFDKYMKALAKTASEVWGDEQDGE